MASLREEMFGGTLGVPHFRMLLPEGWVASKPSAASAKASIAAVEQRLVAAGNPVLAKSLQSEIAKAYQELERQKAILTIAPGPDAPDWAYLPVSIVVTVMRAPSGSLDEFVRSKIVTRGARPLAGGPSVVTWLESQRPEVDGGEVVVTMPIYLIPVPGSGRRQALQFTASIIHPIDVLPTDPTMAKWIKLIDTHLATFSWDTQ